ncbi:hypothetical protein FFI89_017365 [Bradyrhizobium sp. KBS0727]|uniref:DUF6680 family protein n=1 Tax=unclassified Bradyrhizobium TaxID=2631580 RepID=UPI00110D4532|nr:MULTISPECIES: DUF6680 family protein [unclassified Bradyrhizobium]QDW38757.1 hypothetical protein FFI71_017360 [Bradyrhizobium sp. KBS0725]QDW45361.1 hypothetical protein FFI89_017365 [Bradyrhizobium sp. KBS0727]
MAIEWWVVLATIAGPVIAVQTQKWIERATENRNRKRQIFDVMMANRATRLADDHVRAVNMIDLAFLPKGLNASKNREVLAAWRSLFGELTRGIPEEETDPGKLRAWTERCNEFYVKLLSKISIALGYNFTDEELRRGVYYPRGHGEREQAQLAILHGLRLILEGKESLQMRLTAAPGADVTAELQKKLTERMVDAYDADGSLKVRIQSDEAKGST